MKHVHDILRQRLHESAGLLPKLNHFLTINDLQTQWSERFETLMRNRLMMGALRYGFLGKKPKGVKYDSITSAIKRLQQYQQTGNQELLVDAANLCLVEFIEGTHPNKHWSSIDDGLHAQRHS